MVEMEDIEKKQKVDRRFILGVLEKHFYHKLIKLSYQIVKEEEKEISSTEVLDQLNVINKINELKDKLGEK